MVKKTFWAVMCFISLTILVSAVHGQGVKKTMTLPNGEAIWDLNGEWDVSIENYGQWTQYGKYRDVYKITQKDGSFMGVRMIGNPYSPKGSEAVRGEVDKDGFKKVQIMSGMGPLDSTGKISEDGNKMVIDDGEKTRQTYTRK